MYLKVLMMRNPPHDLLKLETRLQNAPLYLIHCSRFPNQFHHQCRSNRLQWPTAHLWAHCGSYWPSLHASSSVQKQGSIQQQFGLFALVQGSLFPLAQTFPAWAICNNLLTTIKTNVFCCGRVHALWMNCFICPKNKHTLTIKTILLWYYLIRGVPKFVTTGWWAFHLAGNYGN